MGESPETPGERVAEPGKGGVALEGLLQRGVASARFCSQCGGGRGAQTSRGACGETPEAGAALLPLFPHPQKSKAWHVYTGSGRQVSRLSLHGMTPGPAIWGVLMGVEVYPGALRGFLGLRKERFLNLCIQGSLWKCNPQAPPLRPSAGVTS